VVVQGLIFNIFFFTCHFSQIKIWFQNRRMKWKRMRKSANDKKLGKTKVLREEEHSSSETNSYESQDSSHLIPLVRSYA
jgi:hypothetical protein